VSQIFYVPTRVFSGAGCVTADAAAFRALGKKALVVTGKSSAKVTGAEADVKAALASQGLGCVVYDGIPPNPGFTEVREAAALARKEGCDFIIGIGGGSPLDAAKAIAVLAANDLTDEQLLTPPFANAPLPLAAIPTTAGTGSEVTNVAVLRNERLGQKSYVLDPLVVPHVAILDPTLTAGLPPLLTAATGFDALTHAIEAYTSRMANPMSDAHALHAIRLVAANLERVVKKGDDLEARSAMQSAATLAGWAITSASVGLVHGMSHAIGARHGVPHGVGNGILLPHVMRWNAANPAAAARYADVATALGADRSGKTPIEAAALAAERVEALLAATGHPRRLSEVSVPKDDLSTCAEIAMLDPVVLTNPRGISSPYEIESVYEGAF